MYRKSMGQNLTEYAIIIAVVSAALIGMQTYMKRGMQGRLRGLAKQISPTQYQATNTAAVYGTTRSSTLVENQNRSTFTRKSTETSKKTGSETTIGDE